MCFIRITDTLFYVQTEDATLVRRHLEQLIEFLNDAAILCWQFLPRTSLNALKWSG